MGSNPVLKPPMVMMCAAGWSNDWFCALLSTTDENEANYRETLLRREIRKNLWKKAEKHTSLKSQVRNCSSSVINPFGNNKSIKKAANCSKRCFKISLRKQDVGRCWIVKVVKWASFYSCNTYAKKIEVLVSEYNWFNSRLYIRWLYQLLIRIDGCLNKCGWYLLSKCKC